MLGGRVFIFQWIGKSWGVGSYQTEELHSVKISKVGSSEIAVSATLAQIKSGKAQCCLAKGITNKLYRSKVDICSLWSVKTEVIQLYYLFLSRLAWVSHLRMQKV